MADIYYKNKKETLADLFGVQTINITANKLNVGQKVFPIIDDVIILLAPEDYPAELKKKLGIQETVVENNGDVAQIQFSFGAEWKNYNKIIPEHVNEFENYFDLVDFEELTKARVMDVGCGIGRWAYFVQSKVREIILLDFSMAIFEARKNLRNAPNALFFMGDLTKMVFRDNSFDFIYSLGVLHHLPSSALANVITLGNKAPYLLIYLYYALDNRPNFFQALLLLVTKIRASLSRINNDLMRSFIVICLTYSVYLPLIFVGKVAEIFGKGRFVPLFEFYQNATIYRIKQDVYDRFFTGIEQRVSRSDILSLSTNFEEIKISSKLPYWHFICRR